MCKKGTDNLFLFMCIEIPASAEINGLGGAGIDFLSAQNFTTGVQDCTPMWEGKYEHVTALQPEG